MFYLPVEQKFVIEFVDGYDDQSGCGQCAAVKVIAAAAVSAAVGNDQRVQVVDTVVTSDQGVVCLLVCQA